METAGCNAKVRARDLLPLIGDGTAGAARLAGDSFPLSVDENILFSIDTVLPVTRNPRNFGRIAVTHALNDLHAQAARPHDVCVSYGFDMAALEDGAGREIIIGAEDAIRSAGANLTKAHTYQCGDVTVSVAAIGRRTSARPALLDDAHYAILLTKPLGGAIGYHIGALQDDGSLMTEAEHLMLQGHGAAVEVLSDPRVHVATDVTGFGLIGHLASIADRDSLQITVQSDGVPILPALTRFSHPTAIRNCSAVRNREDFRALWRREGKSHELAELVMFSGETSGPIACIVQESDADGMTEQLRQLGYSFAARIGSARHDSSGGVQII